MKISSNTAVTFPSGGISGIAKVVFCKKENDDSSKLLIVTNSTPFHPLDYNWPDQPGDKGKIIWDDKVLSVNECLIGALHQQTGEFLLDQQIKVARIRRDDPNWHFVVAHVVESASLGDDISSLVDKNVNLEVDSEYRLALSQSHTACHLAALALNKATLKFWKKPLDCQDSLGSPNFDKEAIVISKIYEENSGDHYRCGKSLRKKGFDCEFFLSDSVIKETEAEINNQLMEWCSQGLKISVEPAQAFLHEVRRWNCLFPDGKKAVIPCGGTHINVITPNQKVVVSLQKENEQEFKMISKLVTA